MVGGPPGEKGNKGETVSPYHLTVLSRLQELTRRRANAAIFPRSSHQIAADFPRVVTARLGRNVSLTNKHCETPCGTIPRCCGFANPTGFPRGGKKNAQKPPQVEKVCKPQQNQAFLTARIISRGIWTGISLGHLRRNETFYRL